MIEMKMQAMAEYPVRAREPLPPNESAPVPFRVSRAGRVVDVVDLPSNVAVVQARLGRVRYSREEMKSSFAEFLALEPQEVKAGTYCVFTVMNVGVKPVEVTGKVIVEGEHGEAVQGLREATPEDESATAPVPASRDAARRNPANDAIVDSIIDNATMADGTPVTKSKSKASKSSKVKQASGRRRPSPTPTTSPMPRARATMKPQKIMTRTARRQRFEAEAGLAAESGLAPHSSPLRGSPVHGTFVAALHIGHVAMLDLALSARIPLGEDVRGEISSAIHAAREDATVEGVGVVALHLSKADCERLAEAVDARAEYTLDDTEAMRAAVQQALDPKAETAVPTAAVEAAEPEPEVEPEATLAANVSAVAETVAPSVRVEKTEVGNVTPISTSGRVRPSGASREERGESLEVRGASLEVRGESLEVRGASLEERSEAQVSSIKSSIK